MKEMGDQLTLAGNMFMIKNKNLSHVIVIILYFFKNALVLRKNICSKKVLIFMEKSVYYEYG